MHEAQLFMTQSSKRQQFESSLGTPCPFTRHKSQPPRRYCGIYLILSQAQVLETEEMKLLDPSALASLIKTPLPPSLCVHENFDR